MDKLSLREIQNVEFSILKKFDSICRNENLHYVLGYGTLLGAARHKGFIPWDDDLDVWMPRDDYERFLEYCSKNKKELDNFRAINYRNEKKVHYTITRFSDMNYYLIYDNKEQFDSGIFIDIYPFDKLGNDILTAKKEYRHMYFFKYLADIASTNTISFNNKIYKIIIMLLLFPFCKLLGKQFLRRLLEIKAQKFSALKSSRYYGCPVLPGYGLDIEFYEQRFIFNRQPIQFEGDYFWGPKDYSELLTHIYGDYMKLPPESQRDYKRHGYDAFKRT